MSTPADDANRGDIILEKWLSVIDHLQVNIINYNVKLTCSPAPIITIIVLLLSRGKHCNITCNLYIELQIN